MTIAAAITGFAIFAVAACIGIMIARWALTFRDRSMY